jgi:hypothetical protein
MMMTKRELAVLEKFLLFGVLERFYVPNSPFSGDLESFLSLEHKGLLREVEMPEKVLKSFKAGVRKYRLMHGFYEEWYKPL